MERIISLADHADLRPDVERLHEQAWPRFILDGHTPDESGQLWGPLLQTFPQFQLLLVDETGQPIAAGHTIPLIWDGTLAGLPAGWAGSMIGGFRADREQRKPTTLAALSMAVSPGHRGRGVAGRMLAAMKDLVASHNLDCMIAPVRPNWKERYPLTNIERYVQWTQPDGSPFDPWIRAHRRCATPLAVAHRSMTIIGTAAEWERWTDMRFPDSGVYIVPGALVPVLIDKDIDRGRYEEPNFWMAHSRIAGSSPPV